MRSSTTASGDRPPRSDWPIPIGNPDTAPDPAWTSLIAIPPYPDYTSGLNGIVGSASRALARALGTNRIDLYITSVAAGVTRHYEWAGPLNRDAIDARVWGGLHFRFADVIGNHRGQRVATYVLANAFGPVRLTWPIRHRSAGSMRDWVE